MAFPTSPSNNQVWKEGNRAFVFDSATSVWDRVREADSSNNDIQAGTIGSGVTGGAGLTDVPGRYFYASKTDGSNQSLSTATNTLCTFEQAIQSHTSFSLSNEYFTAVAADAGDWLFMASISYYVNAGNLNNPLAIIYHNGSSVMSGYKHIYSSTQTLRHHTVHTSGILTIGSGDTIKIYGFVNGTSPMMFGGDTQGTKGTSISGVKL